MKRVFFVLVIIMIVMIFVGCPSKEKKEADVYVCTFQAADEDYVNFDTMEGFMNSSNWSIIEKVKLPANASTYGWHMFRGKGWEDKEGDVAIELSDVHVYSWVRLGGWNYLAYDVAIQKDRWYNICIQHDASSSTLYLYVDGVLQDTLEGVGPIDDSGNTNRFFFGGQDVDPAKGYGDLYTECDITIAHQAWFQRILTLEEIQNYAGKHFSSSNLFFETQINADSITDASGNGHDGTNGNSPVYELL